jgi:hypothetical protein
MKPGYLFTFMVSTSHLLFIDLKFQKHHNVGSRARCILESTHLQSLDRNK